MRVILTFTGATLPIYATVMLRSQLARVGPRPGCEHGRDLSPWRAPDTVVMIKSCFTNTLPESWRVPAGARSTIRGDLSSFSEKTLPGLGRCP